MSLIQEPGQFPAQFPPCITQSEDLEGKPLTVTYLAGGGDGEGEKGRGFWVGAHIQTRSSTRDGGNTAISLGPTHPHPTTAHVPLASRKTSPVP